MVRFMTVVGYFWPFRRYRNAAVCSELERAAAYRYNRRLARGLPVYLNRWAALSCLLLAASVASPSWLAPAMGIAFALAFCMTLHIAHVYVLFWRH